MYQSVLDFWFEEIESKQWWIADPGFDRLIEARFGEIHCRAAQGELFGWRETVKGRLAEVMVLDQFSRNIYRNTPLAFGQDSAALVLAQEAILSGAHDGLIAIERNFLYMPFMHSESRTIHDWAVRLFRDGGIPGNYQYELKHKAIIDRFGRYPHRNEILGRTSTAEELEFLSQPGSGF